MKVDNLKYIVTGLNHEFCDFDGLKYPWRGPVEAFDWDGRKSLAGCGIHGIDELSYKSYIRDCFYVIIEYDPIDGVVRLPEGCGLKIRKGKVVFLSKKISRIQEWLERRGYSYRGYGAVLIGGDNANFSAGQESKIIVGNSSNVICGDNSYVRAGHGSNISGGNGAQLIAKSDSILRASDNSKLYAEETSILVAGEKSSLSAGYRSFLSARNKSDLTGGKNSVLSWYHWHGEKYQMNVEEEDSGKTFYGEFVSGKWEIKRLIYPSKTK